jgi:hypothetical protein
VKSQKLRNSARNQECTFQIAGVCNGDTATTILCHLPSDTGGMGMKSDDATCAAFGCSSCHDAIDGRTQSYEYREAQWFYNCRAIGRTQRIWIEMGLAVFKGLK